MSMRGPSSILALFFMAPLAAAGADWERVGQAGDGATRRVYDVHMPSIVRSGRSTRAWISETYDVQQVQEYFTRAQFRSVSHYREFDCSLRETRVRESTFYAGPYSTGAVVDTHKPRSPEFDAVNPGSIGERLLQFVCAAAGER